MVKAVYEDMLERIVDYALSAGAKLVIARFHEKLYEHVVYDTGSLREHSFTVSTGFGIDVFTIGRGYSFTTSTRWEDVRKAVDTALRLSKLSKTPIEPIRAKSGSFKYVSPYKVNPFHVDASIKVKLLKEVNRESLNIDGISSAVTRLGFESDYKLIVTSDGFRGESLVILSGFSHGVVAKQANIMERVRDSKTFIGGYEMIEREDWRSFVGEVNSLALKAVEVKTPPSGSHRAIIDNDLVGVVIHEALGHASEGDLVSIGSSVISNMRGSMIAGEHVTVVDNGLVEGGYPVYFDDEGILKTETVVIDKGVLKSYLTSRVTAGRLGLEVTGNARAEGYGSEPLVRQTNFYIKPGDWRVEELFEGFTGLYIRGKGAVGGGQVDSGNGTFSFSAGPSYIVRNGEVVEMVRGVSIAGSILEFLRNIEAVARDLKIETSVFGGCGKNGQLVRVGLGGPHIRVNRVIVGGV